MKVLKKIVLNEKDVKEMLCDAHNLDMDSATMRVSHFEGDQREPSYTEITIEGKENV